MSPDSVQLLIAEIRRHLKALLKDDLTTRSILDLLKLWQVTANVRLGLPLSGASQYLVELSGKESIQASSIEHKDDSPTIDRLKEGNESNKLPAVVDPNMEKNGSKEHNPQTHIHVHMPKENYNFSGANIANSVVGANMQCVSNTIKSISPENVGLTKALDELRSLVVSLLDQLPGSDAQKASANLNVFTQEASKKDPLTSVLTVTSEGLIEAVKTVANISGPIVAVVNELRGILGF